MSFTVEELAVALKESMLDISSSETKKATQKAELLIEEGTVNPKNDIDLDSVTITKLGISGEIKYAANFPINSSAKNNQGKFAIQFDSNLNLEAAREIHVSLQSNNDIRYIYYENGTLVKRDVISGDSVQLQSFSCVLDCLEDKQVANWIYVAIAAACAPACATVVGCAPCLIFAAGGQASVMIGCINECF